MYEILKHKDHDTIRFIEEDIDFYVPIGHAMEYVEMYQSILKEIKDYSMF